MKALRQFRHESQVLTLWVDSICINQLDEVERPNQVYIMGSIYKSAVECKIWLGEIEDEHTEPIPRSDFNQAEVNHLKDLIKDLKLSNPEPLQHAGKEGTASIDVPGAFEILELIAKGKHFHEMPFFTISPDGSTFELCDTWYKSMQSLENLLRRAWWRRIWTVQEALLPEVATVHCGPHSVPFSLFLDGAVACEQHVWTPVRTSSPECCSSIFNQWMGHPSEYWGAAMDRILDLKLIQTLRFAKDWTNAPVAQNLFLLSVQRSATVRHDHVYGLFGLIAEFFKLDEGANYDVSLSHLYAITTINFMKNAKHLTLLPYARSSNSKSDKHTWIESQSTDKDDKEQEFLNELPSWCPDWSTVAWGMYFDIYNYGGFTADTKFTYEGARQYDEVLQLDGILVDTITNVCPLIEDMKYGPSFFVPIIEEWIRMIGTRDIGPRALWEIIHVATHKDVGLEKVDLQANYWEVLKRLAGRRASHQQMLENVVEGKHLWLERSMGCLDKRAIFLTAPAQQGEDDAGSGSEYRSSLPKGSVGMSLPNVRQGDVILVVKGGRTPLICRPLNQAGKEKALAQGIPEEKFSNCYTFVGVTYVYGMMQGQGLAETPNWETTFLL